MTRNGLLVSIMVLGGIIAYLCQSVFGFTKPALFYLIGYTSGFVVGLIGTFGGTWRKIPRPECPPGLETIESVAKRYGFAKKKKRHGWARRVLAWLLILLPLGCSPDSSDKPARAAKKMHSAPHDKPVVYAECSNRDVAKMGQLFMYAMQTHPEFKWVGARDKKGFPGTMEIVGHTTKASREEMWENSAK